MNKEAPKVCISYSHDNEDHKKWVLDISLELTKYGVDISLDEWDCPIGDDLLKFMEKCIRDSIITLIICTPNYAEKANKGKGGVGYETIIITGEIYYKIGSPTKFVPIIRTGEPKMALPSYLKNRKFIDFRCNAKFDEKLEELLRHIHQQPKYVKPSIGQKPKFEPSYIKNEKVIDLYTKFDIPKLLKMDITKAIETLGTPTSFSVPSDQQRKLYPEMPSTAEYQFENTTIFIDYDRDKEIKKIFISDTTPGRKEEEILKIGNLKQNSSEYKIRIQNWLNPELAEKNKEVEIAGIEVTLIPKKGKRIGLKMDKSDEINDLVNTITSKAHWRVIIKPEIKNGERIGKLKELWDLIDTNRVALRGWDYPHLDRGEKNRAIGSNWIASWCKFFMGHQEFWHFFQSAEFEHYFSFWEDRDPDEVRNRAISSVPSMPKDFKASGYISVLSALYSFTEIFEFAGRLAKKGVFGDSVIIFIEMLGIRNHVLFFWDYLPKLHNCYFPTENKLKKSIVLGTNDLIQKSSKYALETMLWFFERFQWYEPPEKLLKEEQINFLERKTL